MDQRAGSSSKDQTHHINYHQNRPSNSNVDHSHHNNNHHHNYNTTENHHNGQPHNSILHHPTSNNQHKNRRVSYIPNSAHNATDHYFKSRSIIESSRRRETSTLDPSQLGRGHQHGASSPGGSNFRQELLNQYKREQQLESDDSDQEEQFEKFGRKNNNSVRILNTVQS